MDQTTRTIVNPYVPASGPLSITADAKDEKNGNASHLYCIQRQRRSAGAKPNDMANACVISFQRGPLGENVPNGISNESLIAIVIDRLECFNDGPFRCRENSLAITALEEALHWMHHRTMKRQSLGLEGKSKP